MAREKHVAVVEHFSQPLVQQEWDIPSLGIGQINLKKVDLTGCTLVAGE